MEGSGAALALLRWRDVSRVMRGVTRTRHEHQRTIIDQSRQRCLGFNSLKMMCKFIGVTEAATLSASCQEDRHIPMEGS